MEALALLFALGAVLVLLVSPVLAFVALARTGRMARDLEQARADIEALERRLRAMGRAAGAAGGAERATAPAEPLVPREAAGPSVEAVAPPAPPAAAAPAPTAPAPAPAAPVQPKAAPPVPPAPAASPRPRPSASRPPSDFATNLGPRLLVGAGALAVIVFLGYFVRYAWENNWVGPTGRVLSGAVFSLGLLAAGLRLMPRVYRPLGQGLAAAGLAGLYVTAFAAHAVYALVPRPAAGLFMFAVTVAAVVLSERLDARLLAALAWIGGYMAPFLLSTGEDRAVSLFGYLLLLGGGAVWLDRRRPWPETLPLALVGTAILYGGWYATFFAPERFWVATAGLVLLGGLFALGAAEKERPAWLAAVALVVAVGLAALANDAGRPEVVLPLSLLAAAALLRAPGVQMAALVAPLVVAVPFFGWTARHYQPETFGIAAAWVAAGALVVALGRPGSAAPLPASLMPGVAVVGGGLAALELASSSDRPFGILGLLLAQAGLAVLVRRRFAWSEAAGAALGAAAVLAWLDRYFAAGREAEALTLGLAVAAFYFVATTVRGFVGERLGPAGTAAHVAAAGLAWAVCYRVLDASAPTLLGPAAVALGAVHLARGLVARQLGDDPLRVGVTLGLAAAFLTIAIPVQLGLHGITIGWALEGLLLLWLGVRNRSWLTRAAGYGVLALAVLRLLARHLPLHPAGAFTPLANPAFGTWLAVIAALVAARFVALPFARAAGSNVLERLGARSLVPLAAVLLFALLTAETSQTFGQMAREAFSAHDAAAAIAARRQGDLAVSVLWTAFATGLLAAGLAGRSRGLFYAGYALFAITAAKVVFVDLAQLPTLYRMVAFLVLGVLLLAGAWLNIRFRERLEDAAADGA
ncbi:MAG: DUF2339 domain-containing protein [Vicinamibacteria bacterium]